MSEFLQRNTVWILIAVVSFSAAAVAFFHPILNPDHLVDWINHASGLSRPLPHEYIRGLAFLIQTLPGILAIACIVLFRRGIGAGIKAVIVSVSVGYGALFVGSALICIPFPYEWIDYVEGQLFYGAVRIASGMPLYPDPAAGPLAVSIYPPFYPFFVGQLLRIFGSALWVGRAVSFLSALGVGLIIFGIVYRKTASFVSSFLAAGIFYASQGFTGQFLNHHRVDALALLLSVAALAAAQSPTSIRLFMAAGLTVAALLTKPSAAYVPLAIVVYFLLSKKMKVFFGYAGLCALFAFIALPFLFATGPFWVYAVINASKQFQFDPASLLPLAVSFWHAGLFLAAAALFAIYRLRVESSEDALWEIALLLAWPMGLLTVLKEGGGMNSLLPVAALSSIVLGVAYARIEQQENSVSIWQRAVSQISSILIIVALVGLAYYPALPASEHEQAGRAILNEIRQTSGDVFLTTSSSFLVLAGKPMTDSAIVCAEFSTGDRPYPQRVLQDIRHQRYALVLTQDLIPTSHPLGLALADAYVVRERLKEAKTFQNSYPSLILVPRKDS